MAIPQSAGFDYEAEFAAESFGESDIVLQAAGRGDADEERLVGPRPKIRLWEDRLVIFTSETRGARMRHASFLVGDAVSLAARAGDWLYVTRGATGDIGLSLLRGRKLVLAVGAVTEVPLGDGVRASRGSDGSRERRSKNTWLEFAVGDERVTLRGREFSQVGEFHFYVETNWRSGVAGRCECAAVWAGDDPAMSVAAIRSAVLLGHGALKMVGWDNSERFAELNR